MTRERKDSGRFGEDMAANIEKISGLVRQAAGQGAEIDAITPDATDLQVYDQLMAAVKQASRHNLSQAQLSENIKALGDIAVAIAKKSAKLTALLA